MKKFFGILLFILFGFSSCVNSTYVVSYEFEEENVIDTFKDTISIKERAWFAGDDMFLNVETNQQCVGSHNVFIKNTLEVGSFGESRDLYVSPNPIKVVGIKYLGEEK